MDTDSNRRGFLRKSLAVLATGAASAKLLIPNAFSKDTTPKQIEGPYYPPKGYRNNMYNNDFNNDLTMIKGLVSEADGNKVYLIGEVRDHLGKIVVGARVEVWQACHFGRYQHPGDKAYDLGPRDPKFQYYGVAKTDKHGRYAFKTILPPAYPSGVIKNWWRPPHIHFKISKTGYKEVTTQIYFNDLTLSHDENEKRHLELQRKDLVLRSLRKEKKRNKLIVDLQLAKHHKGLDARLVQSGLSYKTERDLHKWEETKVGKFDIKLKNQMDD